MKRLMHLVLIGILLTVVLTCGQVACAEEGGAEPGTDCELVPGSPAASVMTDAPAPSGEDCE